MAFLIVLTVIEGVLAVLVAPVPVAVAAYFSLDRERAYAAVSVLGVCAALLGVRPRGGAFELTVNGTRTESGKPAFSERARRFAASAASKCRVTRARVSAAVCLGDAARSEEIVRGMIENYEKDPEALWNTELFGRTFKDMVREGLDVKAGGMPEEVRRKMRRTITRIVNEGRGGVICILL